MQTHKGSLFELELGPNHHCHSGSALTPQGRDSLEFLYTPGELHTVAL